MARSPDTELEVAPSLAFFIVDNFLLLVEFTYRSLDTGTGPTATQYGIGGGPGFNIPLGNIASLVPAIEVAFLSQSVSSISRTSLELGASAPLLFHVAPHFFLGFGLRSYIGGWF